MEIIHVFESETEEVPEGNKVRTKCGEEVMFRPFGSSFAGGKLCQICNGHPRINSTPPFIFAVSVAVAKREKFTVHA